MGINQSKNPQINEIQMQEQADKSIGSLGSAIEPPATPTFSPFQRLKSLSFNNRYEKFPVNSSLNNLAGNLTPKASPSTLKQRLIKALGGYNLLDPRSPSQLFARTPLAFKKSPENKQKAAEGGLSSINRILETSLDVSHLQDEVEGHNPYGIFEDQLDHEEVNEAVDEVASELDAENSHQDIDDDIQQSPNIVKLPSPHDPRSPTEGIDRTPLSIPKMDDTPKTIDEAVKITKPAQVKQDKPQTTNLIKTMYKDLKRKDPIYTDLLLDDEWCDSGKSTPVKKAEALTTKPGEGDRTPLGCLVNKTRNLNFNSTPVKGAPSLFDHFEKDENTPVDQQVSRQVVTKSDQELVNNA